MRLHTDDEAATLAEQVSARAFTVGQDVYFGQGQYDVGSLTGYHLLAHETVHTLQQKNTVHVPAASSSLAVSRPHEPAEQQADQIADQLVSNAERFISGHDSCCDSCAVGTSCETVPTIRTTAATISRQATIYPGGPGGHDPCLALIEAIIGLLDEVAQRFNDALNDRHDLFKYHKTVEDSHPEYGSWDGHRSRYYDDRGRLRQKLAEWDSNDDCRGFRPSQQQQEDLTEAREFSDKEFPERPARSIREAQESEQESVWEKLRKHLPEILVGALVAIGAAATAAALVACFGSGACEFALALAGVGVLLAAGISAALRAAGIEDRPSA